MNLTSIFSMLNHHPICQLATCRGGLPRVRHMMIYRADENGIIFHTGSDKEVFAELVENNNIELCFLNIHTFTQVRISGKAVLIQDEALKEEIINSSGREYLKRLRSLSGAQEFDKKFVLFKVVHCVGHVWSIATHYDELQQTAKEYFYF